MLAVVQAQYTRNDQTLKHSNQKATNWLKTSPKDPRKRSKGRAERERDSKRRGDGMTAGEQQCGREGGCRRC